MLIRELVTRAALGLMRLGVRVLPSARIAVVHGFPDSEENSLRIAAALPAQLPGWRVVLLCEDTARARTALRQLLPDAPVPTLVPRVGPRGFALAMVARLWVHTHGLYGSPRGSHGRLSVLVGHGHGPKRATPQGVTASHHADLAFTNVAVWGTTIIRDLGVPASSPVVVAASPRTDGLRRGHGTAVARTPGNSPDTAVRPDHRPYVVWLPTVRRTVAMRRGQWQDGTRLTEDPVVRGEIATLVAAAARHGLRVVTKVHELDADAADHASLEVATVGPDDLARAGMSFGQFVSGAAALVTDYSSVFVDHLGTGLSIAFWMPDLATFTDDRGFNTPEISTVAPELVLRDPAMIDELMACAARGETWQPAAQDRLATAIGYVAGTGTATEHVVGEIVARLER